MNKKKNSKYDLESKRGSFFLFGLWIAFSLIICAFIYSGKTQVSNADWESDLIEFDIDQARGAYNALMEDFNNYQVRTDKKIKIFG